MDLSRQLDLANQQDLDRLVHPVVQFPLEHLEAHQDLHHLAHLEYQQDLACLVHLVYLAHLACHLYRVNRLYQLYLLVQQRRLRRFGRIRLEYLCVLVGRSNLVDRVDLEHRLHLFHLVGRFHRRCRFHLALLERL